MPIPPELQPSRFDSGKNGILTTCPVCQEVKLWEQGVLWKATAHQYEGEVVKKAFYKPFWFCSYTCVLECVTEAHEA